MEILLVLGLMVILGTLFFANVDLLFREEEALTVENAFWTALREARLEALLQRRPVVLRFDEEESAFFFQTDDENGPIRSFPVIDMTPDGRKIRVAFVQERPRSELILIRGQLIDTRPVGRVVLYPDGSSTSFWLELEIGGERRQIRVDPWTGAEVLDQSHR